MVSVTDQSEPYHQTKREDNINTIQHKQIISVRSSNKCRNKAKTPKKRGFIFQQWLKYSCRIADTRKEWRKREMEEKWAIMTRNKLLLFFFSLELSTQLQKFQIHQTQLYKEDPKKILFSKCKQFQTILKMRKGKNLSSKTSCTQEVM